MVGWAVERTDRGRYALVPPDCEVAFINALHGHARLRVLARPHVWVSSNETDRPRNLRHGGDPITHGQSRKCKSIGNGYII
jgi:hypothetical protein